MTPTNSGATRTMPASAMAPAERRTITHQPVPSMRRALRSEWIKMWSVRSTWVFIILISGALYSVPFLTMVFSREEEWTMGPAIIMPTIGIAWVVAQMFIANAIGGDVDSNMAAQSFLRLQAREHWFFARIIITIGISLASFVFGSAIAWGWALVGRHILGTTVTFEVSGVYVALGGMLALVFAQVITAGVAALLRSRTAAIFVPLMWFSVIEGGLSAFIASRGWPQWMIDALPGNLMRAVTSGTEQLLSGPQSEVALDAADALGNGWPLWVCLALLAGWGVVAVAVGTSRVRTRDCAH